MGLYISVSISKVREATVLSRFMVGINEALNHINDPSLVSYIKILRS
jgi:hypothetical protein